MVPASILRSAAHADHACLCRVLLRLRPVLLCIRAAKARIEKAEAQGRAREEQMELLQAVRAYMAQARQQAAAKALATQQV